MKKMRTICAILAFFVFAVLASPVTVHAANAADMKNYDEEAKEIFLELTDAFSGIGWIEEEIPAGSFCYDLGEVFSRLEYNSDLATRVTYSNLTDIYRIIYYWTYYHYQRTALNDSALLPSIEEIIGNSEDFSNYFLFKSFSGNSDKALDEAFRKICDFQYDYMLAHDNQPYDFTVFIQNDSIKVSDESSSNEPDPSGSREKESEEPSEEILIPSQSLEPSQSSSQESPSNEVKEEDDERSPWEAVMNKVAGCMLSILILAVAGIALFIVRLKKGKSSRKGD